MTDFKAKLAKVQSCTIKNGMLHNGDISDVPVRYLDAQAVEALVNELVAENEKLKNKAYQWVRDDVLKKITQLEQANSLTDEAFNEIESLALGGLDMPKTKFNSMVTEHSLKIARETRERVKELLVSSSIEFGGRK